MSLQILLYVRTLPTLPPNPRYRRAVLRTYCSVVLVKHGHYSHWKVRSAICYNATYQSTLMRPCIFRILPSTFASSFRYHTFCQLVSKRCSSSNLDDYLLNYPLSSGIRTFPKHTWGGVNLELGTHIVSLFFTSFQIHLPKCFIPNELMIISLDPSGFFLPSNSLSSYSKPRKCCQTASLSFLLMPACSTHLITFGQGR